MIGSCDNLRLVRLDLLAAAVGSVWLMLFLAGAVEPADRINPAIGALGPARAVALSAAAALGLAGGYLCMHRDARAAMALLLLAVAAALAFGQTSGLLALLVAAGVVLHSVVGRYVPALGIVTVGLMWSAGMAITNPALGFGHPIALAMTHVMGSAALLHVYARKRPPLGTESGALIVLGWAFWVLLGVSLIGYRRSTVTVADEQGLLWVGPMLALAGWIALAGWMVRRRVPADRLDRAATLWLLVYAVGWLVGAGEWVPALALAALAVAAWIADRWRRRRLESLAAETGYRAQ